MSHIEARTLFTQAFQRVFGTEPTEAEVAPLQGVGYLETGYASWWKGAGVGSWNFGAIQAGKVPCDPARSFQYVDTHPLPDGTSQRYTICFRKYPSALEGATDLVRTVYVKRPSVLQAARSGDLYAVSKALHSTFYYEGIGATVAQRIRNHHKALTYAVQGAEREIHGGVQPRPRTLRIGSVGEDVRRLQERLAQEPKPTTWRNAEGELREWPDEWVWPINPDGKFGERTDAAVEAFQAAHSPLTVDGEVGPKTRKALSL